MRQEEKQQAIQLREAGYSYSYIVTKLGVSKSTLTLWLRGIPYVANRHTIRTIGKARARSGEQKAKAKKDSFVTAQRQAESDIGKMTARDIFILGVGLYIGEGSKTADIVRIVNSDPRIIRYAVRWFEVIGVPVTHLVARIHGYPDTKVPSARTYWSQVSGIPVTHFQLESIDRRVNKKATRNGTCPHGTLHISVRAYGKKELGVALSRKIGAWMDQVLEYGA
jgi:hypothetical protein